MLSRFALSTAAFAVVASLLAASPTSAPAQATMPACASGDPVVWENSKSKVYHLQGDSYYGKTKSGSYACQSAANAAGYHVSGSKMKSSASSTGAAATDTSSAPAAAGSAAPTTKHHHHHHHMSGASPAPAASGAPVPAAT